MDFRQKVDSGDDMVVIDCRSPQEFQQMRLGVGETLVPLGTIRDRLDEFPKDKSKAIVCFCKISLRGYEAASILMQNGYDNVKVLEGGIMAWPYHREK